MPSDIFYCANELIYDTTAVCESSIVTSFRLAVINVYACLRVRWSNRKFFYFNLSRLGLARVPKICF